MPNSFQKRAKQTTSAEHETTACEPSPILHKQDYESAFYCSTTAHQSSLDCQQQFEQPRCEEESGEDEDEDG